MDFKKNIYEYERTWLSPFAQKSQDSAGRQRPVAACVLRTDYQRDRDRIIHCKAFRLLKHKTQVFLAPEGDYYRTRLTHTLEVSQIARTVAQALRLNQDLTEAIALAHDLGHTPFGHAGERALNEFTHFNHAEHSLRVVDVLENEGRGMNLTREVRDGILNHQTCGKPSTLEGEVVRWSDKIAYINHDIDDALRGGVLSTGDIPKEFSEVFGTSHGERINTMIMDIINNSYLKPKVSPSPDIEKHMTDLRRFLFENVYTRGEAKAEEGKAVELIKFLYGYYYADLSRLPKEFIRADTDKSQCVSDYIASLSDNRATKIFKEITVPKGWSKD